MIFSFSILAKADLQFNFASLGKRHISLILTSRNVQFSINYDGMV